MNTNPSKSGVHLEGATYLRVEKPSFLFLEGSGGTTRAPVVAAVALAGIPAALAGASTTHAVSSADRLAAGAPAPAVGTCSTAASAARGDGGEGFHLSGAACPRRYPLPPPLTMLSSQESPEGRVLAARAADTPHFLVPGAPTAGFPSPSCAPPAPAPTAAQCGRPPGPGASVGLNARHPRSPSSNGIG
jgi:hypothetical protein